MTGMPSRGASHADLEGETIPVMKPWFGVEEALAAAAAVTSGWVAQGPRVAAFEERMCAAVGAQHGVAVSSCTAGLHGSLVAMGIGPGDEVVVPSLSFIATANAVRHCGAVPVFADVDRQTQNITRDSISAVLSSATRAVILVHQAGVPADIDAVHALCEPRGITVLEDAACAIGSTYHGRRIGAHSSLVVFSFHPRKLLTTGEGGMVMTSDSGVARRLRRLREHGMDVSAADRHRSRDNILEGYAETGYNYRLTDIQAAIGIVQLGRLDGMIARRRELAQRYHSLLAAVPGLTAVQDPAYGKTNFQSFWILLGSGFPIDRNRLLAHLMERGIIGRRGIMAAHLEPAYAGHPHADLPVTEELTRNSLILPLFHDMTEDQQDRVVTALLEAATDGGRTC